ncbi:DUF3857 domain-containing protein [bacterium]|nr:DUF3857 domain-containing protein [bacterium]
MKSLQTIAPIIAILIAATAVWAVDVDQILSRRDAAAELPPTDSAILYHGTTYTLSEDGRVTKEEHIFRYHRNLNAWDEYGDPHIAFDGSRQKLEVQISRTHVPDGRKVDSTPHNAYNPIVPFGLDLAPEFTDMRQMVVTHLGIEHDVVTELKYTISDTKPFYPWTWDEILFGDQEPISERVVTVKAPRSAGLQFKSENGAPDAVKRVDGNTDIVTWTLTDLPSYDFAEAGSHKNRYLPRATFSTCPSWDEFLGEVGSRFKKAVNESGKMDKAITRFAEIDDDLARLDSTITFIKDRIALKNFGYISMLFNWRDVAQVCKTGYGSPADIAAFYTAGLMAVGFEPVVYLLGSKAMPLPGITGDEDYSIYVEMEPLGCRINPSNGKVNYLPPEGVSYLTILPTKAPQQMPVTTYAENGFKVGMNLTFCEMGGAEGWIIVKSTGAMSMYDVAAKKGAESVIEHFTSDLHASPAINDAVLTLLDRQKVEARAALTFEPITETLDGLVQLVIPWEVMSFHGFLPDHLELYQKDRDIPVYLGHPGWIEINVTINIPEGWTVAKAPATASNSVDGISWNRVVEVTDASITFSEKVVIEKDSFEAAGWSALSSLLFQASSEKMRTLLVNTDL